MEGSYRTAIANVKRERIPNSGGSYQLTVDLVNRQLSSGLDCQLS